MLAFVAKKKLNARGQVTGLASQRCILLTPSVLQVLGKHRKRQHEERLHLGSGYENNDLLFATSIGTPLKPRNVIRRHLKPILVQSFLRCATRDRAA
jgi:hypothetical protein